MKNIPFSIFALARFPGARVDAAAPNFVGPLDLNDVDEGIAALGCCVDVALPRNVCPSGEVRIEISKMSDLKPHHLVRRSEYLSSLVDALDFVKTHRTDPAATAEGLYTRFSHLPLDLTALSAELTEPQPSERSTIDSLFSKIALPDDMDASRPTQLDAQIEDMLKTALSLIYNDPAFRQLEATLRGVQLLVKQGPVKKSARQTLTLYPADGENLEAVLRHIVRHCGERAPSLVLVDMPFDNSFASIDTLETLANFADAVNAPTAVCLAPKFFGLEKWDGLLRLGYLPHELDSQPYAKFRALKEAPSARWLTLTMPELCVREAYGSNDPGARPVAFKERLGTWTSPVWALGTLAAQSQSAFGWPTRLTDHGACRVKNLVVSTTSSSRTPLFTAFSEERINQFHEIGTAPLRSLSESDEVFLNRAPNLAGGTLGYQLFVNRVLGFFFDQRDRLAEHSDIRSPNELVDRLRDKLMNAWRETAQPEPDDLVIGIAHDDHEGEITLSIRMTPPRVLVPEKKLLEIELAFRI